MKMVVVQPEETYNTDIGFIEDVDEENECETHSLEATEGTPAYSMVHLSYRENEDLNRVLLWYASAVKVVTSPLFAMITGQFSGSIAGQDITFMVNSGSELNLMSEELHGWTRVQYSD